MHMLTRLEEPYCRTHQPTVFNRNIIVLIEPFIRNGSNTYSENFNFLLDFQRRFGFSRLRLMYLGKRKVVSESEIKSRLPDEKFEVLGIAERLLGNDRIMVRCLDGFTRICRIKGKMKRRAWIRVNDLVIVSPWDFQSDTRGDITHRYQRNQADWLRNNGYLEADFNVKVG